jgi:hypothetical protein
MGEEVVTLVRIPVREIEETIRKKHVLPNTLIDVQLDSDFLILYFSDKSKDSAVNLSPKPTSLVISKKRKRRARRKRNRTKTRGWEVVARITNAKGQTCAIYKPFFETLKVTMLPEEQKAIVTKILKSNGNRPSETTINYFLENTLEYLASIQDRSLKG